MTFGTLMDIENCQICGQVSQDSELENVSQTLADTPLVAAEPSSSLVA